MKILASGIHIDDIEYGMGGIVALLSKMGHEVLCLTPKPYQHYKGRNIRSDVLIYSTDLTADAAGLLSSRSPL